MPRDRNRRERASRGPLVAGAQRAYTVLKWRGMGLLLVITMPLVGCSDDGRQAGESSAGSAGRGGVHTGGASAGSSGAAGGGGGSGMAAGGADEGGMAGAGGVMAGAGGVIAGA